MSENQEQHKTWIMLKKSIKFLNFNTQSDVIPLFNSNTKASNEYGTWSVTHPKLFDSYDNVMPGGNYASLNIDLTLPDNVLIHPSKIITRGEDITFYVSGYNPITNTWESLGSTRHPNHTSAGDYYEKIISVNNNVYYSKFRFTAKNQSKFNIAEAKGLRIESGTIQFK